MNIHDRDRLRIRERLAAEGIYCDVYALRGEKLAQAVPVLLRLLAEIESFKAKMPLVRVVSDADIPPQLLVEELRRIQPELEHDVKPSPSLADMPVNEFIAEVKRIGAESTGARRLAWALADGLEKRADESVYDDLVELIRDKRFGKAREMLAYALAKVKSRREETIPILLEAVEDEELTSHALDALGKMKAVEAIPAMRRHLEVSKPNVRTTAKKWLKRLEKVAVRTVYVPEKRASPLPIAEGAAEASMNFDLEQVPVFLTQLAPLLEGFGHAEIEQIESLLIDMEIDEEERIDFTVRYQGEEMLLQIEIFMDDIGAPDVAFFTQPALAEAIDQLMEELMPEFEGFAEIH